MWRRLPLAERLRIVFAVIEDGFALVAASIGAAHPEHTPEEFRAALFERIYGYIDPKITPAESASSAPFDCTEGPEPAEG